MIQGTYYKEWSRMLGRDMEFKVYGHAGTPVLALPARGGRFYDQIRWWIFPVLAEQERPD